MDEDDPPMNKDVKMISVDECQQVGIFEMSELSELSELKDRIKAIRVREHMTQYEFAKRINATPGFISNVENGRSGLSDEKLQAIVSTCHVSEQWLRTGEGLMSLPEEGHVSEQWLRTGEGLMALPEEGHVSEQWLKTGEGLMSLPEEEQNVEEIGGRIKKFRKQKNLSQDEFAKKIGVHKNRVCAVETGKAKPSKNLLNKIVRTFNTSYDWLMTGEGAMENHEGLDEDLIEWLNQHPDVIRELRERAGM